MHNNSEKNKKMREDHVNELAIYEESANPFRALELLSHFSTSSESRSILKEEDWQEVYMLNRLLISFAKVTKCGESV